MTARIASIATLVFSIAAAVGCGRDQSQPPATAASVPTQTEPTTMGMPSTMGDQSGMMGMGPEACPMGVPGTTVQVVDTANGVGMTFKTTGDVEELRRRVRMMAQHERQMAGGTGGGPGMQGGGMQGGMQGGGMQGGDMHGEGMHGMGGGAMPPAQITVSDTEGGAFLLYVPTDPSAMDQLRQRAQMHATHMTTTKSCPAMGTGGGPGINPGGMQSPDTMP